MDSIDGKRWKKKKEVHAVDVRILRVEGSVGVNLWREEKVEARMDVSVGIYEEGRRPANREANA